MPASERGRPRGSGWAVAMRELNWRMEEGLMECWPRRRQPASQMAAALSPSLRQARGEGRVKEDRSDLVGADITAEGDKKLRGDKKLYIHASIHSYIQTCIHSHIGLLKNANISSIS